LHKLVLQLRLLTAICSMEKCAVSSYRYIGCNIIHHSCYMRVTNEVTSQFAYPPLIIYSVEQIYNVLMVLLTLVMAVAVHFYRINMT
jgi:hypothetical protein